MVLVEEIPKGSDPNVYFSSSINLKASKAMYSSSNTEQSRKRLAAGSYNLTQLEANARESNLNEDLIEVRKSTKRHQELDRENYNEQQAKIELPRSGLGVNFKRFNSDDYPLFDLISYSNHVNKGLGAKRFKQGQTLNTRKVLMSRKTANNYYDEDPDHSKVIRGDRLYSNKDHSQLLLPGKKLCSICGSNAPNQCVRCGVRFCSVQCLAVHKETRCSNY